MSLPDPAAHYRVSMGHQVLGLPSGRAQASGVFSPQIQNEHRLVQEFLTQR